MIKIGDFHDHEAIMRMSLSFFEASPYKDLGIDRMRVEQIIDMFLSSKKEDKIILLWVADDKPVGILAGLAELNIFNFQKFAGELIWWIDEEHRKTRAAEEMRRAFEFWAKKVGCKTSSLVDLMGNMDTYYKRKGYDRRETTYLKVL